MSLSYDGRKYLRMRRSEEQLRRFRRERQMNLDGHDRTIPVYEYRSKPEEIGKILRGEISSA